MDKRSLNLVISVVGGSRRVCSLLSLCFIPSLILVHGAAVQPLGVLTSALCVFCKGPLPVALFGSGYPCHGDIIRVGVTHCQYHPERLKVGSEYDSLVVKYHPEGIIEFHSYKPDFCCRRIRLV